NPTKSIDSREFPAVSCTEKYLLCSRLSGLSPASSMCRSMGPPYSRSARTPSPRNRGRAILSPGGVCLDSALHWWLRRLRVFPVWDSESGSVFGLITGDPLPVTPSRSAWFPFATVSCDWSLPPPPHTASGMPVDPLSSPFFAESSYDCIYDQ